MTHAELLTAITGAVGELAEAISADKRASHELQLAEFRAGQCGDRLASAEDTLERLNAALKRMEADMI